MIVGVVKETFPGERRVALVPTLLGAISKLDCEVLIENGAGVEAGFTDAEYTDKGAQLVGSRDEVLSRADILVQVRAYGANPEAGRADLEKMRHGQMVIGNYEPLTSLDAVKEVAARGVTLFAMELIPRITRAQSMDVLSSMATIAGYKAVLIAADKLPKMFPMMMTAAGTLKPARVFVIGAGVAGLQAIASSKRLGARVQAYDLRPAVKEQVESLGAKFVEMELDTDAAEGSGGYAKAMDEEFYRKQRELMTRVVAEHDVVITTAAVPGKKAPILITRDMVRGMAQGSVVVDLAAERGGNCEITVPGQTVEESGVQVVGPVNLASEVPYHASQMYAKNLVTLMQLLIKDGAITLDTEDEIVAGSLATQDGEIVHPRVREAMGLPALTPAAPA